MIYYLLFMITLFSLSCWLKNKEGRKPIIIYFLLFMIILFSILCWLKNKEGRKPIMIYFLLFMITLFSISCWMKNKEGRKPIMIYFLLFMITLFSLSCCLKNKEGRIVLYYLQSTFPLLSTLQTKSSSLQSQLNSTISVLSSFLDTLQNIASAASKTKGLCFCCLNNHKVLSILKIIILHAEVFYGSTCPITPNEKNKLATIPIVGSSTDLGLCLSSIVLQHRAVEGHLKTMARWGSVLRTYQHC